MKLDPRLFGNEMGLHLVSHTFVFATSMNSGLIKVSATPNMQLQLDGFCFTGFT